MKTYTEEQMLQCWDASRRNALHPGYFGGVPGYSTFLSTLTPEPDREIDGDASKEFLNWWNKHPGVHTLKRYEVGEAVWMDLNRSILTPEPDKGLVEEIRTFLTDGWFEGDGYKFAIPMVAVDDLAHRLASRFAQQIDLPAEAVEWFNRKLTNSEFTREMMLWHRTEMRRAREEEVSLRDGWVSVDRLVQVGRMEDHGDYSESKYEPVYRILPPPPEVK